MMRRRLISIVTWSVGSCMLIASGIAVGSLLAASGAGHGPTVHIAGSYATGYASLTQLRQDASSVALLESTGNAGTPADNSGVPTTLTTMKVVRLISGSALPATIDLRQLGEPGDVGAPVVTTGTLYIAYLTPFQFEPGVDTGEYTLVGGLQGLFEQQRSTAVPSNSSTTFEKAATAEFPDEPTMPSAISISQASSS